MSIAHQFLLNNTTSQLTVEPFIHLACIKVCSQWLCITWRRLRKCVISQWKLPCLLQCEAVCALVFVIHRWSCDDVNSPSVPTVVGCSSINMLHCTANRRLSAIVRYPCRCI